MAFERNAEILSQSDDRLTGSRQERLALVPPAVSPPTTAAISDRALVSLVEALLLVAPEPTTVAEMAEAAEVSLERIERALEAIGADRERGWVVQRHRDRLQLTSAPRFAAQVRRFLGLDREVRLSPAALETVAIIAYRQPVTRSEIEAVRGVDCSGVLGTLHSRGLIDEVDRSEAIGHPIRYGTTPRFLRHFGLRSLDELPDLGEINGMAAEALLNVTIAGQVADEDTGEV